MNYVNFTIKVMSVTVFVLSKIHKKEIVKIYNLKREFKTNKNYQIKILKNFTSFSFVKIFLLRINDDKTLILSKNIIQ